MTAGAPLSKGAPPPPASGEELPGDLRMVATLWPVLLASAVGLVPFTVFSTFLVPIADDSGASVAAVGSMRGLGGLAALVVGTALAPFIDRFPKESVAAGGLVLLGLATVLGTVGDVGTLMAFCLLTGAATAVLNPALGAAAAESFQSSAAGGRAATLVTATQSLTAMLAAPLIALPATVWGWRGDLLATAAIAALLALLLLRRRRAARTAVEGPARRGYVESFRELLAVPGVPALLLIALVRTAAFMGYLAYLAAFYSTRFGLSPGLFAFVWTLSGASFFVGNLVTGRIANSQRAHVRPERLLPASLASGLAAIVGFYLSPHLAIALAMTAVLGLSHAATAACVITLLIRRTGTSLQGSALSINAAAMSLGVFAGAGLGGIGLGLAGFAGTATAFGVLTLVGLLAALTVRRAGTNAVADLAGGRP